MADIPPYLPPIPPPIIVPGAIASSDVQSAFTAFQSACVKWSPAPGSVASEYQSQLNACDATLHRYDSQYIGIGCGVIATLAGIAFYKACRSLVKVPSSGRVEGGFVYAGLAILGAFGG